MATPSKLKPGMTLRKKGDPDAPIMTYVGKRGRYCRCLQIREALGERPFRALVKEHDAALRAA